LTGVFTLAPLAVMDKRPGCTWSGVLRNWTLVFVGNFAGALTVALFMAIIFTNGFVDAPNAIGQKIGHIGEGRTVGYAATVQRACSRCLSALSCATGWCLPVWWQP
jgi:formate/nitrite transporter FocA (FNT family)